MNKEKSISKNSIYYLVYNVLNVIFPFITGIYVARILLQSDIGQIETAKNLAQYFVIFSFLGIPTYGLREISKARNNKEELSKLYSELIIINTISTCIFSSIYYVLIISVPYYHENFTLYAIAGLSIILNFFNNSWLYEGLEEFRFTAIRNLLFKIISFILLLLLVRSQKDYIWYLLITVIGIAGNYILNVLHSRSFIKFKLKNLDLKRHLKPIFFLVVVNLAIEIYSLVDITMLGFMSESKNVAIYSYGMKIYKVFLQVINTFTVVLVPRISFYFKEKKLDDFNRLISKTLKVILLLSVPLIVGIYFVSDYILTAIYGTDYSQSANVLKVLSLILIISPIGYLLGSRMLLVTGNENKMIIPVGAGAVTNVIANLILIHFFDEIGAAIASVIGELVVMSIYLVLGHKYYKLNSMFETLIKESFALIFMVLFLVGVSFLPINKLYISMIQICGGIIIYFGSLICAKESTIYSYFNYVVKKIHNINKK